MLEDHAAFGLRADVRQERMIIAFWGELDILADEVLAAPLARLARESRRDLVLDLSAVTFLDCGGLTLLCRARDAARRREAGVVLVVDNPFFRKVLRLAGLMSTFEIAGDLETALMTGAEGSPV
ncbi:anti-sigma factor antagonist [Streptomyces sp. p1417]|uniref:Anti-sigma factor antagonist n=1 Tax=Streptomyces typhae TaxID=2681492 RepID=A0A6L6WXE1_9ACTN|nr:STAS domain-containing protein [Streptomyces typhae]MVO85761.1 anti-sigma factor antagonist [Streptomyces typhae]